MAYTSLLRLGTGTLLSPGRRLLAFKGVFLEGFVNRAYHELEKPLGDSPTS